MQLLQTAMSVSIAKKQQDSIRSSGQQIFYTDYAERQNKNWRFPHMLFWIVFFIFYLPLGTIFKLVKRYM